MQKFGDVEKIEVLRGKEAQVLNEHFEKTGKAKVSDFSDEEKAELTTALEATKDEE